MSETSDDGIEQVHLGYDLIRAEIIRAACVDAGIAVQLVRNEHPETGGFTALSESYLLVRTSDVDAVRRIIRGDVGPATSADV